MNKTIRTCYIGFTCLLGLWIIFLGIGNLAKLGPLTIDININFHHIVDLTPNLRKDR